MEINDEFRRDVAAGLRLIDVSDIGDDDNIVDDTEESAVLFMRIIEIANDYRAGLHYFPSHFVARDAVDLFADLIDRPTCDMEGHPGARYGRCSHCGAFVRRDAVTDCTGGIPVKFCPNCGEDVEQ